MPLDGTIIEWTRKPVWSALRDLVCLTYQDNPYYLPRSEEWYDNLYRRKDTDDLRLELIAAKNELTGVSYPLIMLNDQMGFSNFREVRELCHPRSPEDPPGIIHPDQLVGVRLHDYGYDQAFFERCEEYIGRISNKAAQIRVKMDELAEALKPYFFKIYHDNGLDDDPTDNNRLAEFRFTKQWVEASSWHRDQNPGGIEITWRRVKSHVIIGNADTGSEYALERNNYTPHEAKAPPKACVTVLPGATASHIALKVPNNRETEIWALRHRGRYALSGRVLHIEFDQNEASPMQKNPMATYRGAPTPWKLSKLTA